MLCRLLHSFPLFLATFARGYTFCFTPLLQPVLMSEPSLTFYYDHFSLLFKLFFANISIENSFLTLVATSFIDHTCFNFLSRVLSSFMWIISFVLRNTGRAMGEHGIKYRGKNFLNWDYAEDLSILDKSLSRIDELLEVLRVQGARISLLRRLNR